MPPNPCAAWAGDYGLVKIRHRWLAVGMRACLVIDLASWAIVLGLHSGTFDKSHVYDLMAAWMEEGHWAIAFATAAIITALGLGAGARFGRLATILVAVSMQAAVAVSFGGGPYVGTGFGTHLAMLLIGLLLCHWEWRHG